MIEEWTGEVVRRLHIAGLTNKQLAAECGYTAAYLSTVLSGKKGTAETKERIFRALERLENGTTPTEDGGSA